MTPCEAVGGSIDDVALGAVPSAALVAHLAACPSCAEQLERTRRLAERIDRAVAVRVRSAPSPALPRRIAARAAAQRAPRYPRWLALPAGVALAGLIGVVVAEREAPPRPPAPVSVAAIGAWRSPTASLLVAHDSILRTPFTLHGEKE